MPISLLRRLFGLRTGLFENQLSIGNPELVRLSIASVVANTVDTRHYVVLAVVAVAVTGMLIVVAPQIAPWSGGLGLLVARIYAYDFAIFALAIYQAVGQYAEFQHDKGRVDELAMTNPDGPTVAANFLLPEVHKWRSFLVILTVVEVTMMTAYVCLDTSPNRWLPLALGLDDQLFQFAGTFIVLGVTATALAFLHYESVRLARALCLPFLLEPWHPTKGPWQLLYHGVVVALGLGFLGFVLCVLVTFVMLGFLLRAGELFSWLETWPVFQSIVLSLWVTPAILTALVAGLIKRGVAQWHLGRFVATWEDFKKDTRG